MQWDYVYADLQLQVTFEAKGHSPFMVLTDREIMVLQQLVYQTLTIFNTVRAMDAQRLIDHDKIRGSENAQDDDEPDGG